MARKIRVKSGNTTATVDDQLARSIEHTLKALAPDTTREIEKAIERIYQEAHKDWPQRYHKSKSQNSKSKLERGITLDISTGEIYGYVRNTAEYAWAIKVGKNTKIDLPLGARVSNELLWKPMRKLANPLAKIIAEEITRLLK